MPQNLNALLRYKVIDNCLRNPYIHSDIAYLQEACSAQLGEQRGIYKLVSERSIREDLRVMRSDALGFNAPIVVDKGIYSYSEEGYSIFKSQIPNLKLLGKIYDLLLDEKPNIQNPKLEDLLEQLAALLGKMDKHKSLLKISHALPAESDFIPSHDEPSLSDDMFEINEYAGSMSPYIKKKSSSDQFNLPKGVFSWGDILEGL